MPRPRHAPGSVLRFTLKRSVAAASPAAYLAARLSVSPFQAERLLARGCVDLDGCPLSSAPDSRLNKGSEITVRFPDDWDRHRRPQAMPLAILYEDEALVVLDKPPGLVVHPARGHMDGRTLQNGVRFRFRHALDRPETCIAPAHRLDRDTSGVIAFSLTRDAYRHLVRQFTDQHPRKEYLALVDGRPAFTETTIAAPLGVDPKDASRGAVVTRAAGGKPAATDLRVERLGADWALVRARPRTGRPHQVRLHLAHAGVPVVGDRDYNPLPHRRGAPRQALHATRLTLTHPIRGERVHVAADLPADFRAVLAGLEATAP